MAKRYKHVTSGAVVSVRDDKVLGSEWAPVDEAPAKRAPKATAAKSDSKTSG
jgi:hypothetical protein